MNKEHKCFDKARNVSCFGLNPMNLEFIYITNRTESGLDCCEITVNFCPFCGLKAEKNNE